MIDHWKGRQKCITKLEKARIWVVFEDKTIKFRTNKGSTMLNITKLIMEVSHLSNTVIEEQIWW